MSETTNLPAVSGKTAILAKLPATVKELTPVQLGWLTLADMKETTFKMLEAGELKIQGLLKDINTVKELSVIQQRIKEARDEAKEKKEVRLHLTNTIQEKLVDKAMEFEKRNDTLIQSAATIELERRKVVSSDLEKGAALTKEKELYKAHIKNEWLRIASTYRLELERHTRALYAASLAAAKPMTAKALKAAKEKVSEQLATVTLEKPVKFVRTLMSIDEAKAVIASTIAYNAQPDLDAAITSIDTIFAMYNEDFKNKVKSIKANNEAMEAKETAIKSEMEQEKALNNLVASADTIQYSNTNMAVKKKTVIVLEDTEEFVLAVMSHFISYFHMCKKYLKVKKLSNLSIEQMAAALQSYGNDNGKKWENFKYKDEEK